MPADVATCWSPALRVNLALDNDQSTIAQRCQLRGGTLSETQAKCELHRSWCGGITRDGGLHCGNNQLLRYEMRTRREIHHSGDVESWITVRRGENGECAPKQSLASQFAGKLSDGRRHRDSPKQPPSADVSTSLQLRHVPASGVPVHSRRLCVGPCCTTPLQRNRTCAFRDLLFVGSTRTFYFLSSKTVDTASHATFLHNRFADGDTTGKGSHSYFSPAAKRPEEAAQVTKVIESPLYIGADVHSNIAHLMLDSVFPSIISLLRLQAAHASGTGTGSARNLTLPDAVTGAFTFLLYDSPRYTNFHRGKKERAWTSQLAGGGVVDLDELAAACPGAGCLVRSAWVGAGHVGLCPVDEYNMMGGARLHRSLWRFRHRIYHQWGVPHTPLPPPAGANGAPALPKVLVVQTKRVVTNLPQFIAAINQAGIAEAQLIKWETMSFKDQLGAMRSAAVQVSGVGSAQINQFMLPRGAVALCLGWRDEQARSRIHYFDHHILTSLDHVRVVYYPSYTKSELGHSTSSVTLDVPKAVGVVKEALGIYQAGYDVPVPPELNSNRYDRAFLALVRESNHEALMQRTGDYNWADRSIPANCYTMGNGVEKLLWGRNGDREGRGTTSQCNWYKPVSKIIQEYGL